MERGRVAELLRGESVFLRLLRSFVAIFPISDWQVEVAVGAELCRDLGEAVSSNRGVKPLLRLKAAEYACSSLCVSSRASRESIP